MTKKLTEQNLWQVTSRTKHTGLLNTSYVTEISNLDGNSIIDKISVCSQNLTNYFTMTIFFRDGSSLNDLRKELHKVQSFGWTPLEKKLFYFYALNLTSLKDIIRIIENHEHQEGLAEHIVSQHQKTIEKLSIFQILQNFACGPLTQYNIFRIKNESLDCREDEQPLIENNPQKLKID